MKGILVLIGSSVGKKMLMAITGLCMIGFLVAHLLGNSLVFVGADAFNDYAKKLHSLEPLLIVFNKKGALLANPAFVQIHPTSIPHYSDHQTKLTLMSESLRNDVYYGVQTLRAMENFAISGVHVNNFQHMISALAFVKKAAARANFELGVLDKEKMEAICNACDELLAGKLGDQFTVDMFQGGAGTSTNMMANEVIANRGLEPMGFQKGEYDHLHPNDHVNCSQSTNDAYPTAIKLAVLLSLKDLLGAMGDLKAALEDKGNAFADVLKMGRTENQDAVPMTLGNKDHGSILFIRRISGVIDRLLNPPRQNLTIIT